MPLSPAFTESRFLCWSVSFWKHFLSRTSLVFWNILLQRHLAWNCFWALLGFAVVSTRPSDVACARDLGLCFSVLVSPRWSLSLLLAQLWGCRDPSHALPFLPPPAPFQDPGFGFPLGKSSSQSHLPPWLSSGLFCPESLRPGTALTTVRLFNF